MSFLASLLKGSGSLLSANLLTKALSVLVLPLLTAWLSPALYGEAALASTLISLVSVVFLAGMDMSYSRAYFGVTGGNTQQVEALLWCTSFWVSLCGGIVAAIIWWWYSNAYALHQELAGLVFFGAFGSVLATMAQTRARLLQQYRRLATVTGIAAAVSYALMLLLAKKPETKAFALLAGYVSVYWFVLIGLAKPKILDLKASALPDIATSKGILRVGIPGIIMAPAYWVLSSADRWFLGASFDAGTVGIYAIAVSFGTLGMMLNSAVLSAWVPEMVRHSEGGRDYGEIVQAKILVLSAYAWVWLAISLLAPFAIRLLVDHRFHAAVSLVPWIAGGVFFYGCYHLFNSSLYLQRKLSISAYGSVLSMLIALALMAYAVPRLGMQGAAIAQCLGFFVHAGFVAWRARENLSGMLSNQQLWFGIVLVIGCYILMDASSGISLDSALLRLLCLAAVMISLIVMHRSALRIFRKGRHA